MPEVPDFQIRRNFETKSPEFQEVGISIPELNHFKKQMRSIDAKLPSNLLFRVYAGMGPSDSPAFFGTFCVSNAINKLVFYNIKINSDHRNNIENTLVDKYGQPSVTKDSYKLWQKDSEKLILLGNREILYLNETHLNEAISKMTLGVKDAKNNEIQLLAKIFATFCDNAPCFHNINWNVKEAQFTKVLKNKQYFIRKPKKTRFNYFPFGEDKMLKEFEKKANPTFLKDKKITEYSGFNEDKSVPVGSIKFYFSINTNNLLYSIIEIDRDYKKQVLEMLSGVIGDGKEYALGKYWDKNNIYIFNSSSKMLYLNKTNVEKHISLVTMEGKKETDKQKGKMKKTF